MTKFEIIFDLDSTLIFAHFEPENVKAAEDLVLKFPKLKERIKFIDLYDGSDIIPRGTGIVNRIAIILRPHLKEFIDYTTLNYSEIHIWSAGQFRYVRVLENLIFPPNVIKRILSAKDCIMTPKKVIKEFAVKNFDHGNSLIIDDREDTFEKNEHNAIHIPRYEPKITYEDVMKDDIALLAIMRWMESTKDLTVDIRTIEKPALTFLSVIKKMLDLYPNTFDTRIVYEEIVNNESNYAKMNINPFMVVKDKWLSNFKILNDTNSSIVMYIFCVLYYNKRIDLFNECIEHFKVDLSYVGLSSVELLKYPLNSEEIKWNYIIPRFI